MENFTRVAKTSDISDGEIMAVEVGTELIVLSRIGGEFYAINEMCSHANGPLSNGHIDGDEIECPWHGSRFCLKSGEVKGLPATEPVPCYAVRVEGDDVLVGPA